MRGITTAALFSLFIFGCASQHTEDTTPPPEVWQQEEQSNEGIQELVIDIDGESADRVVLHPAPITIYGAYTAKEAREAVAHIGGCENLQRARFGDRSVWVCSF